jgi:hypothetical protein
MGSDTAFIVGGNLYIYTHTHITKGKVPGIDPWRIPFFILIHSEKQSEWN